MNSQMLLAQYIHGGSSNCVMFSLKQLNPTSLVMILIFICEEVCPRYTVGMFGQWTAVASSIYALCYRRIVAAPSSCKRLFKERINYDIGLPISCTG